MSRLSKRQSARAQRMQKLALESLSLGEKEEMEQWAAGLSPQDVKRLSELFKELPDKKL